MGKINRRVNITVAVCSNAVILPEVSVIQALSKRINDRTPVSKARTARQTPDN
jgi:hypothetical protein